MKKNRFMTRVMAIVSLFAVSFMSSCSEDADTTLAYASLELSTKSLTFDFDGTSSDEYGGQVEITSNRDWTISIPDADQSWLSVDFASGNGNQTVTFSLAESTSSRYSTVTIAIYNDSGVISSESIEITQGTVADENSIAHAANVSNAGTTYSGLSGTVVALTAVSYVVVDETGGILVYAGGTPPFEIGDIVTISGTTTSYGGLGQFDNSAVVEKTGTTEVDFSSPTVMSGSDLDSYISNVTVKYVKYTGTLSESGSYVNITNISGASSAIGSVAYAPDGLYSSSLVGESVDVYGYLVGVSGTSYVQTAAVCVVAEGGEFELPELGEEEVDPDDLPTNELTGTIAASDFIDTNATTAPNAIFGKYMFVWSKGTNTSNGPTYYTSGDAVRMYVGNTLTISTTDGSAITSIDFELVSSYDNLSVDTGSYADGSWTGSASTIVFTSVDDDSTTSYEQSRIISMTMDGFEGEGGSGGDDNSDEVIDISKVVSGTACTVKGTVVAVATNAFVLSDGTASIYVYGNGSNHSLGDVLSIKGTPNIYNNGLQFAYSSSTITTDGTSSITYPSAATVDSSTMGNYTTGTLFAQYVECTGTLTEDGNYADIEIDGADYTVCIYYATSDFDLTSNVNNVIKVKGYVYAYSSSYSCVSFMVTSLEVVSEGGSGGDDDEDDNDDQGGSSVIVNDGVINVAEVVEALGAASYLTEASSEFALDGKSYTEGNITVSFDKGTSNYMRLWNASGTIEFRFYSGNILTIESSEDIESVEFDVTSGYTLDEDNSTSNKKIYNFTATTKPKVITVK